ncbi:MAG: DMT family transporter [Phycisphaerales bacterium]
MLAWVYLVAAGLLEIAWALGLKMSNGFTRPGITAATIVLMILSFALLSLAMRSLPLGTSYAVWTGIGIVGTAILGIVFLNEPANALRLGCIVLILVGIAGLKLTTR